MQFFRDLYFTRVSFLGSTHDFTQVQVNIVLFTLLHIYPYISKMIPQFVVSLSNRIGLCRRHWLGQLSAITFSFPPKSTQWSDL